MTRTRPVGLLLPLTIGLLVAVALQAAAGWWLNSGPRVVAGELVFLILAAGVSGLSRRRQAARLVALWLGVQIGLTGFLFWMGPGTIWPLTLAMGGVLSAVAVAAGGGLAYLLTKGVARST